MDKTDEQRVTDKYPRAVCYRARFGLDGVAIYDAPRNSDFEPCQGRMLSSQFHATEPEAWADAARRLEEHGR